VHLNQLKQKPLEAISSLVSLPRVGLQARRETVTSSEYVGRVSETRIWVLVARAAQNALVFRRGPAKEVLLLRWDMARDVFEEGQWLKGRIFERRCDLSPSGERLVYFAAKHKGKYPTYTAVSRPPWLTALALWEGFGTWGGGGLFADEDKLELNARAVTKPNEGGLAPRLRVVPFGEHPGLGEDEPLSHVRLLRDGWTLAQAGTLHRMDRPAKVYWTYEPPRVYRRAQGTKPGAILEMRIHGMHEVNGPWYVVEHAVLDARGLERASLGRTDWADFDALGRLVFARDGRIHRVSREHVLAPESRAVELVDLRPLRFTQRTAPPWAHEWLSRRE